MAGQKEDVTIRWIRDGSLINEHVEHRMVYRPTSKPPYIRSLGARTPLASDNPPVVEFTATTVRDPGGRILGIASD